MKNYAWVFIAFILLFAQPESIFAQVSGKKIIDLTYSFNKETIYWPTENGFQLTVGFKGETEKGYHYEANTFCAAEHGGTHLDAPAHFYANRSTVDQISLDKLMGDAIVIDVSVASLKDADYLISKEDFLAWEAKNGKIKPGVIVLLRTGYGKFWPDRTKYMGTDKRGTEGVQLLHFPGLSPAAADWLIKERKIKAVGIDTPSIDFGQSSTYETHVILTKEEVPIFENVANLNLLPFKDFTVIALPMKIGGGSGAPLRIIALLNQ
ncbi:cyclase family protein [Solitalea sp. MAHUQ-68]|uniref:Cyclase family protein n=1 Tax=Solitalea agri TaxID=2953739 RepID=A0A9X2F077_9SPHI|nr:cyclase family protein [Solitalea agri]MCO4291720.1 cyclase family protein [Solitalea agri]